MSEPKVVEVDVLSVITQALAEGLDAAQNSSSYRWPQQEDLPPIADRILFALSQALPDEDQMEELATKIEALVPTTSRHWTAWKSGRDAAAALVRSSQ